MTTKSLCFKWGSNWIIFCNKCGSTQRFEPQYVRFYKLLGIEPPNVGTVALENLVRHLRTCKGNKDHAWNTASLYWQFNQIRLMKRKAGR